MADDTRVRTSVAEELGSAADLLRDLARPTLPVLPAGTLVAEQFEIEALLGRGGMGAVYRARDRSLGRRVALKLGLHGTDVSRLEREATALARLAHPNVVTIYEIGTHDAAPFVVMELCGTTARTWLESEGSWRAIVELFVAAGRGLAAAHAAGIVHGDIKPDNILVGDDGRPRIADFGLARDTHDDAARTGGTPSYMAPELAHGPATAASDQYAFAITLREALGGRAVPRRISAALARATSDTRWPDVATLLAQLESALRRRWVVPTLLVGAAVLAGGAWWLSQQATEARLGAVQPTRCEGLPVDLAVDWNPTVREQVRAAHPRGSGATQLTVDVIDALVADWSRARRRLCKELPTLASWSPSIGDAGRACLMARRAELRGVIAKRDLDPSELLGLVYPLVLPATCADPARLDLGVLDPDTAALLAEVDAIAQQKAEGHGDAALTRARTLVASLAASAPPLAVGAANSLLGELLLGQAGISESAAYTRAAFFAYRVAGSPQAFEPALRLVDAYAQAGELALAEEWLQHARTEARRVTLSAMNHAALDLIGARVLSHRGDHAAALAEAQRVLEQLATSSDPRRVVMMLSIKSSMSTFLASLGRLAESVALARESVDEQERLYGPRHPLLITDLFNVGLGELDQGHAAQALPPLTRAREIADASLPATAVLRGYALWNQALALGRSDRRAARPLFDSALAIIVAAQGDSSADAVDLRADRKRWSDG